MPAKRKAKDATDGALVSKPKAKRTKAIYKMPPPLPEGEILTSLDKSQWKIGQSIGKGGFGEIYNAVSVRPGVSGKFVMKVEPHENGPLFSELAFYQRVAKGEKIESWKKKHSLDHLGVPRYVASGTHMSGSNRYRFLVMDQFGEDLEKKFTEHGRRFTIKTVCSLAIQLALEFIHSQEYVHADIKGSNVLLGYRHPEHVFLVDYGLAYRYCPEGVHKPALEDPRRAHNGTIEFTSRDAHRGANPSRRGDLEILGFCMVQWASSTLPWMDRLSDCSYVAQMKDKYMKDLPGLFAKCFGKEPAPLCLRQYLEYCSKLRYDETPDYERLRQMFLIELEKGGSKSRGSLLDWSLPSPGRKSPRRKAPAIQKEAQGSSDSVEVDVRSARSLDAKILQRKRPKQNGSCNMEKQAKASVVQKRKEIRGKVKQLPRDADLSDSPEPTELPSPKRVRKQARSSPAIPSPSKYKFRSRKQVNYRESLDDSPPKRSKK